MKNRIWPAVAIGAVAFLRTAEELWFRTRMPVHAITFWALTAYFTGIVAVYAVTDVWRIKIARRRKKPKVITLNREEWDREASKTTVRKERNETRGRCCSA